MIDEHPRLRLVESEPPAPYLQGSRWPVDLRRFPYRPGEMPESLLVSLPDGIAERACREGLPTALWARLAIEATRIIRRVVDLTGRPAPVVEERLRAVASGPGVHTPGLSPLSRYASALLEGGLSEPHEPSVETEIFIPSEMALCWHTASSEADLTLKAWMSSTLRGGFSGVAELEARAAASGESLAAWCYAASLA